MFPFDKSLGKYVAFLEQVGRANDAEQVLMDDTERDVSAFAPLARLRVRLGKLDEAMDAFNQANLYESANVATEIADLSQRMTKSLTPEEKLVTREPTIDQGLDF